jgi:arylsulfatase A
MNESRRKFLKLVFSSSLASALSYTMFCNKPGEKKKHPNFIIFLSDDLGFGDLACYGNPIVKTPHIDAFANQGIRFTDCHSAGTVCSPSRAGLLTGRNPYRSGFYYIAGGESYLRREEKTIATILRDNGYDTCFVGKWHLSRFDRFNNQPNPGDHGFDHWFATAVNAFEGPNNPTKFYRNGKKVPETDGWYCDVIVKEAIDWMRNRTNPEKPFFLLVCSHEPHTPLVPPEKYSEMYDNPDVDELEKTIHYGGVERPNKKIIQNKKYYYGTVTQLDAAFGDLMRGIDELKLTENSLVFFTSDNGPETPVNLQESRGEWDDPIRDRCFGTPGQYRGMKRFTYEGGHRIPGIMRWPGIIKPGSISDEFINGTDIFPTLSELANIHVHADKTIDGASIIPVFSNGKIKRNIPQCWFFPACSDAYDYIPQMAMRIDQYSLLGWFNQKKSTERFMDWLKKAQLIKFELYDLNSDIQQQKDISADKPEIMQSMIPKMKVLWENIQAEGPYLLNWKAK